MPELTDILMDALEVSARAAPSLQGYVAGDDKLLIEDASTGDEVVAQAAQLPGHVELVFIPAPIGPTLSLAEVTAAIPNPVSGRIYMIRDTGGNAWTAVWDNDDWWKEKLTRCA